MKSRFRALGLRTGDGKRRLDEALDTTADAFDDLDTVLSAYRDSLERFRSYQQTADSVLGEHDRRLEDLFSKLEGLETRLGKVEDRLEESVRNSPHGTTDSLVRPSDLDGFLGPLSSGEGPGDTELVGAVRVVLEAMRRELTVPPLEDGEFPESGSVLVLCSARADRLEAFLRWLSSRDSAIDLTLIGRKRDLELARAVWQGKLDFSLYEAEGPYRLEACSSREVLKSRDFEASVYLDGGGLWGDRLPHCVRLLRAIHPDPPLCWGVDDNLYRVPESGGREVAEKAMGWLLEWFDERLRV